jgi:hypothetical protein
MNPSFPSTRLARLSALRDLRAALAATQAAAASLKQRTVAAEHDAAMARLSAHQAEAEKALAHGWEQLANAPFGHEAVRALARQQAHGELHTRRLQQVGEDAAEQARRAAETLAIAQAALQRRYAATASVRRLIERGHAVQRATSELHEEDELDNHGARRCGPSDGWQ